MAYPFGQKQKISKGRQAYLKARTAVIGNIRRPIRKAIRTARVKPFIRIDKETLQLKSHFIIKVRGKKLIVKTLNPMDYALEHIHRRNLRQILPGLSTKDCEVVLSKRYPYKPTTTIALKHEQRTTKKEKVIEKFYGLPTIHDVQEFIQTGHANRMLKDAIKNSGLSGKEFAKRAEEEFRMLGNRIRQNQRETTVYGGSAKDDVMVEIKPNGKVKLIIFSA